MDILLSVKEYVMKLKIANEIYCRSCFFVKNIKFVKYNKSPSSIATTFYFTSQLL